MKGRPTILPHFSDILKPRKFNTSFLPVRLDITPTILSAPSPLKETSDRQRPIEIHPPPQQWATTTSAHAPS